ncbi:50S ribosomal protein L29 [Blattabacterium cuenoti]|uniref:50S ribosomal protein L29 n=1 Tax=Blattabacterium cuenoti TaxID=1653831 RepID=UPI00163B8954|nr:50S ribosomal protein L29 [Blattabacterium cuenoti]
MKNSCIKNLSIDDLIQKIKISEENYHKLKFNHYVKMNKNTIKVRFLRRNIAKLKTELNKRKINK